MVSIPVDNMGSDNYYANQKEYERKKKLTNL